MPYGGNNLEKILNTDFSTFHSQFIKFNNKLTQLYIKAIIPMNKLGFYHNDLKASNILVDDNFDFRIIDFGLMNHFRYIFSFNTPLNGILLSLDFIKYYANYKSIYGNTTILIKYLLSISLHQDVHYVHIIEPILKLMDPVSITESTANIHPLLFNYYLKMMSTYILSKDRINTYKSIYKHNLDTIGFLSVYSFIYLIYLNNKVKNYNNIAKCITTMYLKYIFTLDKISYTDFIKDVHKLNLCFII